MKTFVAKPSWLSRIAWCTPIAALALAAARTEAQGEPPAPALVATVSDIPGALDVASLGVEVEVTEHTIVGPNGSTTRRLIPGRVLWQSIPMSRPLTADRDVSKWMEAVLNGADFRRSVQVSLIAPDGTTQAQWNVINAWPSSFRAALEGEGASAAPVESITVVHEGYLRVQ